MTLEPPRTLASLAGWMGAAFLVGVLVHSLSPESHLSMMGLTLAIIVCVFFLSFYWKEPWIRAITLCLIVLLFGVWRFSMAQPSMPRGLIPFSPKGLAYASTAVTTANHLDPRHWLGRLRRDFTKTSREHFSQDESSLLTGIIYGEKSFSKELKDRFRRAGLLHIVAVSGSNITIIVVFVMRFLLLLRLPRRSAFVGVTLAIIAFTLFVDPSASVIRAAIMGWLVELAPVVGRIPRPSRLLLIAAVVFTFWKPWALIFDASFALSFLAMWGLLSWSPLIQSWLKAKHVWKSLQELIASTVGATIMTVPYSMWAFGQMTLWGLITSLLVLSLIPWIMGVGLMALIIPHEWIVLSARGFLEAVLWIARFPDFIPIGVWSKLTLPFWMLVVIYTGLILVWKKLSTKRP
ncbi:ComEC/Rec2 family competence protein [Candidatus Uhrbacteria bacterium]|nr:ComEC/Rec2 family competence protein [Candidatus Uhrbacteria bacterium]